MESQGAITGRDRTPSVRVFPAVLGITTYLLLARAVTSTRLMLSLAASAISLLLGVVAVRWLGNERRAAYLVGVGISLTITVGGILVLVFLTIAALGDSN